MRLVRTLVFVLGALCCPASSAPQLPGVVAPQQETPAPEPVPRTLEDVAAEEARVTAELAAARERLAAAAESKGPDEQDLTEQVGLLTRLSHTLEQIGDLMDVLATAGAEKALIVKELERVESSGPPEEPPYTTRQLDKLRAEREHENELHEELKAAVVTAQEILANARTEHRDRERQRRQALETLEKTTDIAARATAERALRLAELRSRLAAEQIELHRLELEEQQLAQDRHRVRRELLDLKIGALSGLVQLSGDELAEIQQELLREETELERALTAARSKMTRSEKTWLSLSDRLETSEDRPELLVEQVEAAFQSKEAERDTERVASSRLSRVQVRRTLWERRQRVATEEAEQSKTDEWVRESQQALQDLEREEAKSRLLTEPLRRDLRALDLRISDREDPSNPVSIALKSQRLALQRRISVRDENLASVEALEQLHENLIRDIRGDENEAGFGAFLERTWKGVKTVWNYELDSIQETPITVRKIVLGLLILVLGIRASRGFSKFLGTRLLPGLGLQTPAVAAVRTIIFYVLTLTFVLFALKFVDVPLTAFTVLGGALAIGVGFGSQNIVNNFISGLILLVEQPIRVGDLIQVGDLYGNVVRIGARSTQIVTGANIEITVPNSAFLESNVVNLTLSDDKIRTFVSVGLAYGSPVRDVVKILKLAATEHGRVLKHPEPQVLFESFGDNSLVFEVHFWIRSSKVFDRRMIESDIRKRIDSLFKTADLVIAFPQRDVHLDTTSPLQVQLVPAKAEEDDEDEDSGPGLPGPAPGESS